MKSRRFGGDLSWRPSFGGEEKLDAEALVDLIAQDIQSGRLSRGAQLPSTRELADFTGLGIAAIRKAFQSAEARGLVRGHVGRGTFVAGEKDGAEAATDGGALLDLSFNAPPSVDQDATIAGYFADVAKGWRGLANMRPYAIDHLARLAGASWLARIGHPDLPPRRIVPIAGAHQGIALVLAVLKTVTDGIAIDEETYPALRPLAVGMKQALEPIAQDASGMLPEALDRLLAQRKTRLVFLMPNLQNPTGRTMPPQRRAEILAVCRAHGAYIIEDDVYGGLLDEAPDALHVSAPERVFLLSSLSKTAAPGMRCGYLVAPEGFVPKIEEALFNSGWTPDPIVHAVFSAVTNTGGIDDILRDVREEVRLRYDLAQSTLAGHVAPRERAGPHVWLTPEGWSARAFHEAAHAQGILLTPPGSTYFGSEEPTGIRLCLGAAPDATQLQNALTRLASLAARQEGRSTAIR